MKVEGRTSYAEASPAMITLARRLRRKSPKAGQRSLRVIAEELAKAGYGTSKGKPYVAAAVAKMLTPSSPRG